MGPHETNAYRQQLLALRAALLARIAEQRGGMRSRAEVAAEHFEHTEDSTAQTASAREVEFAIGEHEMAELNALDAALARLDAGHYGQCTDCHADIPEARLKATPEAARCLICQEKAEKNSHLSPT